MQLEWQCVQFQLLGEMTQTEARMEGGRIGMYIRTSKGLGTTRMTGI